MSKPLIRTAFPAILPLVVAIFLSLFALTTHAEFTNSKCSRVLTHSGDIQIQRDFDEESGVCFISLHPMDVTDLKYRDYYIDNSGLLLVFNSYGDGSPSKTTGSRGFMTFPIVNDYPDFSIEPNGDVIVKLVSGHLLRLNGQKFSVKEFSPGSFVEKTLSKDNNGGLEIKPATGFWLDQGFKMGGQAIENKSGKTLIYGSKDGNCSQKNSALYDYSDDSYPLLYQGLALENFVHTKCPSVKY